jgi:hypothetical protein
MTIGDFSVILSKYRLLRLLNCLDGGWQRGLVVGSGPLADIFQSIFMQAYFTHKLTKLKKKMLHTLLVKRLNLI